MAIVEPLRICQVCGEMLYDSKCPNGHDKIIKSDEPWPSWVKRPKTFIAQARERDVESSKEDDSDIKTAKKASDVYDINRAMKMLSDEEVLEIFRDAFVFMQRALVHHRKPETLAIMSKIAKNLGEMAEATDNYVKKCRNTNI